VGVGSGDGRGLTQVWGSASEGTRGQAVADRRTFCAISGARYVRHGASYVKSYSGGQPGVPPYFIIRMWGCVDIRDTFVRRRDGNGYNAGGGVS